MSGGLLSGGGFVHEGGAGGAPGDINPSLLVATAGSEQNIEESVTGQVVTVNYDAKWTPAPLTSTESCALLLNVTQDANENKWAIYGQVDGSGIDPQGTGADNSGGFMKIFGKEGASGDLFNCILLSEYVVGYEAAHYADKARGFISTIQYLAGSPISCADIVHFQVVLDTPQVSNNGSYSVRQSPGNSLWFEKYNGVNGGVPAAADGVSQLRLTESLTSAPGTGNEGRFRWVVYNSGRTDLMSLKSDATTLTRNSPEGHWIGSSWNGSANVDHALKVVLNVEDDSPVNRAAYFAVGTLASEVTALILRNNDGVVTLDYQGNAVTTIGDMTCEDATHTWDLSGSDLIGVQLLQGLDATAVFDPNGGTIINAASVTLLDTDSSFNANGGNVINVDQLNFLGATGTNRIDLQTGDVINVDGISWVAGGGAALDLQGSPISNVTTIDGSSYARMLGFAADGDPGGVASTAMMTNVTGVGDGSGTNLTAPAQGTGSGPASLAAATWLKVYDGATTRWVPMFS